MPDEPGALSKAWTQGLDELRAANSGQMAMDAPPIQPAEAPAVEQPSYSQMIDQQADLAASRSVEPEGMSR